MVVCWGGHSINENEYLYARRVGNQLGLRELNICTGCGPGAMEAPMKGAAVGHAQQRYKDSRFIGMTEPSIIAAEPPNPLVNELIIMPDIEKRLEAFVRSYLLNYKWVTAIYTASVKMESILLSANIF